MNDLFKIIFGIPDSGQFPKRMDGNSSDDLRNKFTRSSGNDGDDDDDDHDNMIINNEDGIFGGFPLFNDSMWINSQFNKIINEMNRVFGTFGTFSDSDPTFGVPNMSLFNEDLEPEQKSKSLRDLYLKQPDCACNPVKQDNFSLNIRTFDVEAGTSNNQNTSISTSQPKIFSKSVFIKRVVKPDGSVETIETVKDHLGNEETTITQTIPNESLPPLKNESDSPEEHPSQISWFKKYFNKFF